MCICMRCWCPHILCHARPPPRMVRSAAMCICRPPLHAPSGEASHAAALRVYAAALKILQQEYPGKWIDMHCALPGLSFAEIEKMDPAQVAVLLHEMRVASGWLAAAGGARGRCCGLPAPLRSHPTQPPRRLHCRCRVRWSRRRRPPECSSRSDPPRCRSSRAVRRDHCATARRQGHRAHRHCSGREQGELLP